MTGGYNPFFQQQPQQPNFTGMQQQPQGQGCGCQHQNQQQQAPKQGETVTVEKKFNV